MARTFKDQKTNKQRRKTSQFREPIWSKRFERNRYGHNHEIDELELCPKCHETTDFENGFITCSACDWGNYYPANGLGEEEEDFEYQIAS